MKILTPLQKIAKNARDLGKLIVTKGIENLVTLNQVDINHHYNQILTHVNTLQQLTRPVYDIDRQHQFAETSTTTILMIYCL